MQSKVAWKDICSPKNKGGLGIRRPKDTNSALLLKLGWSLCNFDSKKGWAKWVHLNLLKGNSLWEVRKNITSTRIWKEILRLRPILAKGIEYKIGKGDRINI